LISFFPAPSSTAVFIPTVTAQKTNQALEEYKQWYAWKKITRTRTATFDLCFQLQAPANEVDNWHIHFLVASKQDRP